MKKFKTEVERTDSYIVEFDENIINEKWMDDFRQVFYNFYSLEEHAEHIAQYRARFGRGFIEGYGIPLEDGEVPYWTSDYDNINHAINIKVVDEDQSIDTHAYEVEGD